MREYKFRGQRLDKSELVNGDLIHGVGPKNGRAYILPNKINLAYVKDCHPLDGVEVIPESVGQYTGLKDKNGKDIYHKDIVQDDDGKTRTIEWNNQNAQFYMKTENRYKEFIDCGQSQSDGPVHCDTIEIIGNIYENPELLTTKLNKTLSGDKK